MASGGEDEYAFLFEYVQQYLESPLWRAPIESFVDEHCAVFSADEEENSHDQLAVHREYCALVERLLENHLSALGVTDEQFAEACAAGSSSGAHQRVFDTVMAADDFCAFRKLMEGRNAFLNEVAMRAIAEEQWLGQQRQQQQADEARPRHELQRLPESASARELREALAASEEQARLDEERRKRAADADQSDLERAIALSLAEERAAEERRRRRLAEEREAKEEEERRQQALAELERAEAEARREKAVADEEKHNTPPPPLHAPGGAPQKQPAASLPPLRRPPSKLQPLAGRQPLKAPLGGGPAPAASAAPPSNADDAAAAPPPRAGQLSPEELRRRQETLRAYRDAIVARRRQEGARKLRSFGGAEDADAAAAAAAAAAAEPGSPEPDSDEAERRRLRDAVARQLRSNVSARATSAS